VTTLVVLPKKKVSNGVLMYDDKGFLWSFQTLQWMEKQRYVAGSACQMSKFSGPKNDRRLWLEQHKLAVTFLELQNFFEALGEKNTFVLRKSQEGRQVSRWLQRV
jgi:hypothetical protein